MAAVARTAAPAAARAPAAAVPSRALVLATLGLVAFGLVMVYSATSAAAAVGGGEPSHYLRRQAIYAVVGMALMLTASRVDLARIRALAPSLVLVSLLLCAAVLVVADPVNGARRWLTLGPASFQPSELAKLALALWAAGWLARRPAPQTLRELVRPIGALAGVFGALIMAEPDLGTTITIGVMLAAVLLVAGTPMRTFVAAGAIASAVGVVLIFTSGYRRERFLTYLDPWSDPQNAGFQSVQALIGFGSGGVFGEGLGQGIQKVNYLPEAHTDMIFAVVGEELGLVGSLGVIGAYALFAVAGLRIALARRDSFGKLLAAALTALVCGQAAINLAAVLGLAPLTGIPLPFVSYGGSNLVVQLAAVGILLNIAGSRGDDERPALPDRRRRDGRTRPAGPRGRGRAASARGRRDVRRVARAR